MPRLGIGLPLSASQTQASVLVIDDPLFESFGGNDIAVNYTATRTNLTLYAQDTTQSQWVKTSTGIEGTLYEDPDGGTTGNAITGAASNSTKFIHQVQSVTAGETYTYSAYVKKAALGFAILEVSDGTTTYSGNFNLTGGAVATTTRLITSAIDDRSNGWYRCSITFQALNSSEGGQIRAYATLADNTPTVNVAVADTVLIYIWGQQFEADGEPTDYIVTTTEARTATTLLNDLSKTWDFDSNDIMPEADPDSEGSWEVPANVVLNGDYEELGSELVTNGTFDADSNWIKGTGWTISGGVATSDGSQSSSSNLYQVVYIIGKTYKTQLTVNAINGTLKIFTGTGAPSLTITSAGTYDFTTKADSSTVLFIQAQASTTVTIDNVSVKQVDPNGRWALGTGWSIEDGKAVHDGTSGAHNLTQNGILTVGDQYELTVTVSDYVSGSVQVTAGAQYHGASSVLSANGTYTLIQTCSPTTNLFLASSSFNGKIDNVTVREYAIQPQDV